MQIAIPITAPESQILDRKISMKTVLETPVIPILTKTGLKMGKIIVNENQIGNNLT